MAKHWLIKSINSFEYNSLLKLGIGLFSINSWTIQTLLGNVLLIYIYISLSIYLSISLSISLIHSLTLTISFVIFYCIFYLWLTLSLSLALSVTLFIFFTIFKNTQIFVLRSTLISFGISLLIPFVFGFIPSMFRFMALASKESKNRLCIYLFSKLLQVLVWIVWMILNIL